MHAPYPGQVVITDDDRGPIANLAAWLSMCCMIMFVLSKIVTKVLCIGRIQKDDLFVLLTMVFGVVQVATVSMQVRNGLGQHMQAVRNVTRLQQATLASEIFYVVTLSCAQVAILQYLGFLSRDSHHRSVARYLSIFTGVWAVASFFTVVFQCRAPDVAAVFGGQCIDRVDFWTVWTIIGSLLDAVIGLLPVFLLYNIRVRRSVKAGVLSAFALRLLAIPLAIVRLVFVYRAHRGSDLSYSTLDISLFTTLHMNVSIILTCVPFLKPVLDGLQSGIWAGELRSNSLSHALSTLTSQLGRRSKKSRATTDQQQQQQQHRRGSTQKSRDTKVSKKPSPYAAYIETGDADEIELRAHGAADDPAGHVYINQVVTITLERESTSSVERVE